MTIDLAEALRALLAAPSPCDCGIQGCGIDDCAEERRERAIEQAFAALAAYDESQVLEQTP